MSNMLRFLQGLGLLPRSLVVLLALTAANPPGLARSGAPPAIFPEPREITTSGGDFLVDEHAEILLPETASLEDAFLAETLSVELADRFAAHLRRTRAAKPESGAHAIVMGSLSNPLVKAYCAQAGLSGTPANPGPEGYVLRVDPGLVLIAGSDERGAFYGLQSLRQSASQAGGGNLRFWGVNVRDWPDEPFRGIKLYLPGRANIPFFKRFVRDFMALYKFNTLIMKSRTPGTRNSGPAHKPPEDAQNGTGSACRAATVCGLMFQISSKRWACLAGTFSSP